MREREQSYSERSAKRKQLSGYSGRSVGIVHFPDEFEIRTLPEEELSSCRFCPQIVNADRTPLQS
jgi:hypothetical protein